MIVIIGFTLVYCRQRVFLYSSAVGLRGDEFLPRTLCVQYKVSTCAVKRFSHSGTAMMCDVS